MNKELLSLGLSFFLLSLFPFIGRDDYGLPKFRYNNSKVDAETCVSRVKDSHSKSKTEIPTCTCLRECQAQCQPISLMKCLA